MKRTRLWGIIAALICWAAVNSSVARAQPQFHYELGTLRLAIQDLRETQGEKYSRADDFQKRLERLAAAQPSPQVMNELRVLKREALLSNPLLKDSSLLLIRRKIRDDRDLGLPSNHECNSALRRGGYDNEIAVLSEVQGSGRLTTLYRPRDGGYVGEVDLHFGADRLLFTHSDPVNWKIWEIGIDGRGLRKVSRMPEDVDCSDPCYLPDGKIIFGSTASFQSVPCWHGQRWVTNLYLMNADGSGVRQLCFDQDHDFNPSVLSNGQIIYHRWDYTGINHIFQRQLMVMNPDGTGQRAVYGSNSWFPNALYFPRELPGAQGRYICTLSGYHGPHRMGQLVVVDTPQGWHEADGLVRRISGKGEPIKPLVRDNLVGDDWPKFLHPWPISDKYFLVSAKLEPKGRWGIYLADMFDNLTLIREEPGYALLQPILLAKRPVPPVVPDRADLSQKNASVYLHDIYAGPGLAGVPRGTIKRLRVLAYHFGYRHAAGPDRIGIGGPWEVMRILGTVPVEEDGSAVFQVPANTPISLQPLDAQGKAVQLMRSWMTAMPGEAVSCVGCHEPPADAGPGRLAAAARKQPRAIEPWYGPARGFSFQREVQPVLDRYCVSCHDGRADAKLDLRSCDEVPNYKGRFISELGIKRLHPSILESTGGLLRYTPAYEALIGYVRRVGIEDDVSLLVPGEYHADTSPLIQILQKGHQGVHLDAESWDRLVTWIDLNAPCHGTWGEVFAIPDQSHQRRLALRAQTCGPADDPEAIPTQPQRTPAAVVPDRITPPPIPKLDGWPFDTAEARRQQSLAGQAELTVSIGSGIELKLARIPAGKFVMGDAAGQPDEWPPSVVEIVRPYWMGTFEITNYQYRQFDPDHDPRYYGKRHAASDDKGLPLDAPHQPAVRVSWDQAVAFCAWLSARTGRRFALPTEAQWEWACRAGNASAMSYGSLDADFASFANLGDQCFTIGLVENGKQVTGGLEHMILEGALLADRRFDDKSIVTAPVGRYRPNPWGLYDMHGNAAEWTRSTYRPYPYADLDGRNAMDSSQRRVVRGGSFFDAPARARSAYRVPYPQWQRVFNVGFRVVMEDQAGN